MGTSCQGHSTKQSGLFWITSNYSALPWLTLTYSELFRVSSELLWNTLNYSYWWGAPPSPHLVTASALQGLLQWYTSRRPHWRRSPIYIFEILITGCPPSSSFFLFLTLLLLRTWNLLGNSWSWILLLCMTNVKTTSLSIASRGSPIYTKSHSEKKQLTAIHCSCA